MANKQVEAKRILIDNEWCYYRLRRSRRAKNILLHVSEDGKIEVVVPWEVAYREGKRFIGQKRGWLAKVMKRRKKRKSDVRRIILKTGSLLPVFGDVRRLTVNCEKGRKRARWIEEGDELIVLVADDGQIQEAVARWYKKRAGEYFVQKVGLLAAQAGVKIKKVVVSDARTQWGSCNAGSGRLSLRWGLALAPLAVVDYVIAHEVAHILERNHSKKFWNRVRELDPNYEHHRQWLSENGQRLVI